MKQHGEWSKPCIRSPNHMRDAKRLLSFVTGVKKSLTWSAGYKKFFFFNFEGRWESRFKVEKRRKM